MIKSSNQENIKMFSKLITLLCILPIIYAKIEIDITSNNENERDIHISGKTVVMVGETEKTTFGLNEKKLKKAVAASMGKEPDNIFLTSPTPWGDLFETMNWEPTRIIFRPTEASILSVKNEEVLLKSKELHNKFSEEKTVKIDMQHLVKNAMSTKWSKEGEISVDHIHYNLNKQLDDQLSFISNGLDDFDEAIPVILGDVVEVTMEPQQKLVAELHATAKRMLIRVDYEASMTGTVALNFENGHEGHRFWSLDINKILSDGGLKKTVHATEVIDLVHFTNAKVLVKDVATNHVIHSTHLM